MGNAKLEKELKVIIGDYSLGELSNVKKEPYDSNKFKAAAERVRKIIEEQEEDSPKQL